MTNAYIQTTRSTAIIEADTLVIDMAENKMLFVYRGDRLKPCPFCGGVNLYIDGYEHAAGLRWRVICLDCMAMVDPGTIQQKYRAIEAWNTRTNERGESEVSR